MYMARRPHASSSSSSRVGDAASGVGKALLASMFVAGRRWWSAPLLCSAIVIGWSISMGVNSSDEMGPPPCSGVPQRGVVYA